MQPTPSSNRSVRPAAMNFNRAVEATMKNLADRIRRAVALIEGEAVTELPGGRWRAKSSRIAGLTYTVTTADCTCPDRFSPCKHQLAGPGREATLLIGAMLDATTVGVLRFLGEQSDTLLKDAPIRFREIAASFYRQRLGALLNERSESKVA